MTTAIDTNVIVALWDREERLSRVAQAALDAAFARGRLVIAAPVYAELLAAPGRKASFLDSFLRDTGVLVEWDLDEAIWRLAGQAFSGDANRRRKRRDDGPRRILADFLIGAHAVRRGAALLTLDDRVYRSAFPNLALVAS